MRLLVTGGLGHIGSFLIRNLSSEIEVEEIILIDSVLTQRFTSLFDLPKKPKIRFYEKNILELNRNFLAKSGEIDCVIHLAALTDATGTLNQRENLFNNNLESTKKMIQICGEETIPIVFPSTTSVYGSQTKLVNEECKDLLPQSPYAECKLQEEKSIIEATRLGLKATVLRLGTIHGTSPGMRFHTAVNKFCFQVATGLPITVWKTALNQKRPYLSLVDANSAMAHVISKSLFDGEVYNVLTNNYTVAEIINAIQNATSKECIIEFVESKIMNQLSYEVSNAKFIETGFKFKGNMESDIKDTMELLMGIQCE